MTELYPSPTSNEYRKAFGMFSTGVAVLTTFWRGRRYGMTVNSLTSVSLRPCSLLVCVKSDSTTGQAAIERGIFGVNILSADQAPLSTVFCGNTPDRFLGLKTKQSDFDVPMIEGCLANFQCRISCVHKSGDHDILIANVLSCESRNDRAVVHFAGQLQQIG
jgi:3-hydroxy-9,10-secoandrosta-1,3,5(10)-triene-9,17-dione monooxygenase reductase component